jgi:hypothetical protein
MREVGAVPRAGCFALAAVLGCMFLAYQRLEIGRRVVQAVTVAVVNNQAARDGAVLGLTLAMV